MDSGPISSVRTIDKPEPIAVHLFCFVQARKMLEAKAAGRTTAETTIDLGRNAVVAALGEIGVSIENAFDISWERIEEIAEHERRTYAVEPDGRIWPVQVFSESTGWLRSLSPSESAPTVLVSGIPMHRVKDTNPWRDTESKILALGMIRGSVLDTAMGLGYTAILAGRSASHLLTIEIDPSALEIARFNPWSRELFSNPRIEISIGDALEIVPKLPAASFAGIVHDPPTMALGGDLYSASFYRELRRILKRGGRMFHYVGDPNSALGKRAYPGVMRRLSEAGFKPVERRPEAFGLIAMAS